MFYKDFWVKDFNLLALQSRVWADAVPTVFHRARRDKVGPREPARWRKEPRAALFCVKALVFLLGLWLPVDRYCYTPWGSITPLG